MTFRSTWRISFERAGEQLRGPLQRWTEPVLRAVRGTRSVRSGVEGAICDEAEGNRLVEARLCVSRSCPATPFDSSP